MFVRFVDIFVTTQRALLVVDFMTNSLKPQHWRAFQRYFAMRAAPVLVFGYLLLHCSSNSLISCTNFPLSLGPCRTRQSLHRLAGPQARRMRLETPAPPSPTRGEGRKSPSPLVGEGWGEGGYPHQQLVKKNLLCA